MKQSKSMTLNLSFPYDWSNPDISDDALILSVLNRCIFEDVCRVARKYGIAHIRALYEGMPRDDVGDAILGRMLKNIQIGLERNGHQV